MKGIQFSQTNKIPSPNIYVQMLPEYKGWVYVDQEAVDLKGHWSEQFVNPVLPLDLEIGCGNGFFFEHLSVSEPDRNHVGIEIKYKPLIQTARRVRKLNSSNAKAIRYHAGLVSEIFASSEIDNVHVHFPDPWPRKKQWKHRLLQPGFFEEMHGIQKPGTWVDFKTDSQDYFDFVLKFKEKIPYEIIRLTRDLHQSEWKAGNFETAFERLFLKQNLPIYYCRFQRK